MRTTKLLTLMLLFVATAFTSKVNAQEPTKEETIKWIKETIETYYADGNIKNLKVTTCKISYEIGPRKISAPIDTDLIADFDEEEKRVGVNYNKERKLKLIYDTEDGDKYFSENLIPLKGTSPEIGERMIRAVKHLATFCKKDSPF